jgi:hypothetical protein
MKKISRFLNAVGRDLSMGGIGIAAKHSAKPHEQQGG